MARTLQQSPPEKLAQQLRNAQVIALGDLHGSYLKLVETLLATGLVSMPPQTVEEFKALADYFHESIQSEPRYKKDLNPYQAYANLKLTGLTHQEALIQLKRRGFMPKELTELEQRRAHYQKLYQQFQPLFQKMEWTGKPNQQLILIGDALCDRGPLDQLTLDLVEHLTQDHPERIIRLASNHDYAVLQSLTQQHMNMDWLVGGSMGRALMIAEKPDWVQVHLAPSGKQQVELTIKPPEEFLSLARLTERYARYLRDSKLLHYRENSQTLFSHAPINQAELKSLEKTLNHYQYLPAEANQPFQIPPLLKSANSLWQDYVENAFKHRELSKVMHDMLIGQGLTGFLWIRSKLDCLKDLPWKGQGVKALVHGHDQTSQESGFNMTKAAFNNPLDSPYVVVNLDQNTRKGISTGHHEQEASRLYYES